MSLSHGRSGPGLPHKKEQASLKPGKLQTSMANVLLIFLSFPMLKSVDPTDQRLI
jgi:hypothetical protein